MQASNCAEADAAGAEEAVYAAVAAASDVALDSIVPPPSAAPLVEAAVGLTRLRGLVCCLDVASVQLGGAPAAAAAAAPLGSEPPSPSPSPSGRAEPQSVAVAVPPALLARCRDGVAAALQRFADERLPAAPAEAVGEVLDVQASLGSTQVSDAACRVCMCASHCRCECDIGCGGS